MPGVMPVIAVVAVGTVATAIDLRTRRVPNVLTLGTTAAGLGLAFLQGSGVGAAAIAGGLIGLALMLPGYLFGATGGGDVKLLAAFGTLLGPRDTLTAFLAMALAGGVIALIVIAYRGREALVNRTFAYAPAVAVGAAIAALT